MGRAWARGSEIHIENSGQVLRSRNKLGASRLSWPRVSRTVLVLGLTRLCTDISAEMVSTILPLYLVFGLQMSPLAFGVIDGLYLAATALVRVIAGVWAGRSRRLKEAVVAGYALSRLGLLLAGNVWTGIVGIILIDRLGKGIRTAPRDALIFLSSPAAGLATAFGGCRALDIAGARLGTRLAFKKRGDGDCVSPRWRFPTLDLATVAETPLAETRSIDDQIEWLDDERVLYGDGKDLWVMPADGSGQPRRFMSAAVSPVVVRTASLPRPKEGQAPIETLSLPTADLAVAVSLAPGAVSVDKDLTYSVTVTNQGPADATDLQVEQLLPDGPILDEARTIALKSGS